MCQLFMKVSGSLAVYVQIFQKTQLSFFLLWLKTWHFWMISLVYFQFGRRARCSCTGDSRASLQQIVTKTEPLKRALTWHWWWGDQEGEKKRTGKKGPSECGSGGEAAAIPDVVNDEAGGGDEEVVHPVEAPADRLRVHRVVRDSSAGLINHLQNGGWRGRWAVNMSPINLSPASVFALIKIQHSVHLNSHRWRAVFLEMFRKGSLLSCRNSAIAVFTTRWDNKCKCNYETELLDR